MQNVGIAVRIELVTSSLPAWFKKMDVAANLLSHLLTRGRNQLPLVWLGWEAVLGKWMAASHQAHNQKFLQASEVYH